MIVTEFEPDAGLHDRNRELAAGEEAGFLAVDRDQVRFGQALEEPFALQRADGGAEAVLAAEDEQVQKVAEDQALVRVENPATGTPGGATRPAQLVLFRK